MNELISGGDDFFTGADGEIALSVCERFDTIVIGPGLGLAKETGDFVESTLHGLRRLQKRVVIDADAINVVSVRKLSLRELNAVMTPHPGEAARLLGQSTAVVQTDRFAAVRELSKTHGIVTLLKGAGTIVHDGSRGAVIVRGTPYLATPGSGDVLAGLIGALFCRADSPFEAASLGAWIHAQAGMKASEDVGGPILATDIAKAVASIIGKVEQ
jgi:NAD(P)H-hydrate epimerase